MLEGWLDKASEHFTHIPFMLGAVNAASPKLNFSRIAEALIIAGITTTASGYVTMKVLESQIANIQHSVEEQKSDIRELRSQLYQTIERGQK